jgi:hypothetical protein
MGSKTKTVEKQSGTSTATPLAMVMPGFNKVAEGVTAGLDQLPNVQYHGDYVAQPGDLQTSLPGAYQTAANTVGGLLPGAQQLYAQAGQGPNFGDSPALGSGMQSFASTNPGGMQGAVNAAIDPYMKQLTQSVLPSLQSAGIESGAYGGSRSQQTLPALAIQQAGEQAQKVAAAMAYQDFTDQQSRILQGYGLSTDRGLGEASALTQRMGVLPGMMEGISRTAGSQADLLGQAGSIDLANRQSVIDNQLKQFQYDMTRPFMGYDTAAGILSQLSQGYGTKVSDSTNTTTQSSGGLGNVVAGLGGLAATVAGFPGAGSALSGLLGKGASAGFGMPTLPTNLNLANTKF